MDPRPIRYVHEPHPEALHVLRQMLEDGFLTFDDLHETERAVRVRNAVSDEI